MLFTRPILPCIVLSQGQDLLGRAMKDAAIWAAWQAAAFRSSQLSLKEVALARLKAKSAYVAKGSHWASGKDTGCVYGANA